MEVTMSSIAIEAKMSTRVRLLRERHPYMSELDLAKLLGVPTKQVRSALGAKDNDKPKSRITPRGRLGVTPAHMRQGV
jgi:hypothetical protein